jgi:phosphoglycolate phosphatase
LTPTAQLAILFDLDGTLIDSVPGIAAALAEAFTAAGRTMPAADIRRVIGPPIRRIALGVDPTLTGAELDLIEPAYRALYDGSAWRETILFPTVADTLKTLHSRGHRLFVVTNKPRIPTMQILSHLGLLELFEEILTRDSATPHYPSKAAMLADLVARRVKPASLPASASSDRTWTLMVGDTAEDLEAAEANHLPFAFATYGYGEVPSAVHPLDTLSNLLTIDPKAFHRP